MTTASDIRAALAAAAGVAHVHANASLAPLTTFRVGGAADWLVEPRSSEEIVRTLAAARQLGLSVTLLGGGSNVLISDQGIRGVVVRPRGGEVRALDARRIRADAALTINGLVRWTVLHGAAGLEAWAGTPGTVGGAIYGNAHFGGELISSHVAEVLVADRAGAVRTLPVSEMAFGYDRSRLQDTGEVLLTADFNVSTGDPAALRETARRSLAYRKRTQPLESPSAGCVFQNPQPALDQVPAGIPWSAGALVDRAGLKGTAIGGARVSPAHGNFIVNDGTATAREIRALVELCRARVREKFGVVLREEIVYLGAFDVLTAH